MKAYGVPRISEIRCPDPEDAQKFGWAGCKVNLPSKGGDIRATFRSSKVKKAVRRYWKRSARSEGKMVCREEY